MKKTNKKPSKPKSAPPAKQGVKTASKKSNKVVNQPFTKAVNPVKPEPKKDEPKPKGLYTLEFMVNSSPDVLFEFIATPGGLENWFADRVYIIEGNFVFNWENGEKRLAKQIEVKDKESARYHWLDEPERKYFEFRIQIDDLTGEVALIVSDFADNKEELAESSRLWESQVHDLHHAIGSSS